MEKHSVNQEFSHDTMFDRAEEGPLLNKRAHRVVENGIGHAGLDRGDRMQTIPMTMHCIMHAAQSRHGTMVHAPGCLTYPGVPEVPPAFNRLAHTDFAILSEADESLDWEDYCPAYALGLLTFEAYFRGSARSSEASLKEQWAELGGSSRLAWEQARAIIARSWNALACLEREGRLAGA